MPVDRISDVIQCNKDFDVKYFHIALLYTEMVRPWCFSASCRSGHEELLVFLLPQSWSAFFSCFQFSFCYSWSICFIWWVTAPRGQKGKWYVYTMKARARVGALKISDFTKTELLIYVVYRYRYCLLCLFLCGLQKTCFICVCFTCPPGACFML